jgi:hypothetical protein
MDMAMMLRPLAIGVSLALLTCSGCAAWHYRKEDRLSSPSDSSTSDVGDIVQPLARSLQNVSLHDWSFNHSSNVLPGVW